MNYEYMTGFGTNEETFDMDFATAEDLIAAGITSPAPSVPSPATTPPATTEKQTWLPEDVEGMFSSFFDKLGIGDQAAVEAEDAARMEAAIATAGTPAAAPAPPPATSLPTTSLPTVTPEPWHQKYAPHMVIGGLGIGAAVVLVLAMRKKKEPEPW